MRLALVVLAGCLLAGCAAPAPSDRPWLALDTPNFEIASALSAEQTVALGRELELFRASVELLVGVPLPAPVRVKVLAFDDRGLSRPFNRPDTPAAAFESSYLLESPAGATMVLRGGGGFRGDASQALRHAYTHYLLRNRGGLDRPLWYDEGMAWLAASLEVDPPRAVLGRLPEAPLRVLRDHRWIPIQEILDATNDAARWSAQRRETLAAESWALVHDLHFHGVRPEHVGGQLRDLLIGDVEALQVFRLDLEISLEALDERVAQTRMRRRWEGIEIRDPDPEASLMPRPLSRPDAFSRLGWLALAIDRLSLAERHFEAVLRVEADHAGSLAGLVVVETRRGNLSGAEDHLARAKGAVRNDPEVCLASVRLLLAHAKVTETPQERVARANDARLRLETCSEPAVPASLRSALFGESFLVEGQALAARAPLDHAETLLPSSLEIRLLRARQRLDEGRVATGRALAMSVLARSHDDAQADAARALALPD